MFSALMYCCGNLKYLCCLYEVEVGRTNVSGDFWSFRNFRPQFRKKIIAPPSDKNGPSVVYLKEGNYFGKMVKIALKSTHKPGHNSYSLYAPSNERVDPQRDRQTYKHVHARLLQIGILEFNVPLDTV